MRGFDVKFGYMGLVDGRYMLFATEDEYVEYWILHEYEKEGD